MPDAAAGAAGFSATAGCEPCAGCVVGAGGCAVSADGCCAAETSGVEGADDTGTGDAGCGRDSTALFAAVPAATPSDASLAGRWVFCPTTYPIANATANSSTTIKKPLSSCLLPTTSSNSPVSLFLMS